MCVVKAVNLCGVFYQWKNITMLVCECECFGQMVFEGVRGQGGR